VPARERGAAQGFLLILTFAGSSSAGLVGGALTDHLAGPLTDRTATMAIGAYRTLFAVFGCAAVAAGLLAKALFTLQRRAIR
jgi:MFS family permease